MRKTVSAFSIFLLLSSFSGRDAPADDSDILWLGSRIEPNIIILLDSSGSMNDQVNGEAKITAAKRVISNVLTSVTGVRFALMRFNQTSTGARMVSPVGTPVADMVEELNAIRATGSTPLGRSAQGAEDYLQGEFLEGVYTSSSNAAGTSNANATAPAPRSGRSRLARASREDDPLRPSSGSDSHRGSRNNSHNGNSRSGRHQYDDQSDECDDRDSNCQGPFIAYESPIQYECQKNFVIIVTDGLPNGEDTNLVSAVATSLRTTDHADWLTGTQNATVHTVGYNIPEGTALLTQAAANGGGNFYTANSATELQQAINDALGQIIEDTYNFTAPVIPAGSISTAGRAYFSSFRPNPSKAFWRGYFSAYTRNSSGLIPVDSNGLPLSSALAWESGNVLAAKAPSSRTIYTYASSARQSFTSTNSNITSTLLGVSSTTDKNNLVNYLRGVDTYDEDVDGNVTENRAWKLGDLFHSGPALVTPPPLNLTDSTYQTFKTNNANRTKILLVGANDGMLHAFRESDGEELWAFIPPDLLGNLKNLKPGSTSHPYFVDGTPIVTDIKIGSTWKTVAVFGERRGGRRYVAVDVTDTTDPQYLWSFNDTRSGESWSDPAVGRIRMSDSTVKYVAFVGGGYDSASNNNTGKAVFAIDLSNGSKLWEYYNNGSGDRTYMNFSVAGTATVLDLNADGYLDRVYVGDVGGQLWKFDISAAATTSSGLINNWTGKRLFAAASSQTNPPASGSFKPAQSFYGQPIVAYDDSSNLWVFQGSGDRNNPNDTSSNNFYAIKDNTSMTNGSTLTTANLVSAPTTNNSITQGWYLPLGSKEKALAEAMIHNKVVYFTTFTPNTVASCEEPGGAAKLYAVQMANGDSAIDWSNNQARTGENSGDRSTTVGAGIPSNPTVVSGTTNDAIVVATTEGQISSTLRPSAAGKRLRYWREVF